MAWRHDAQRHDCNVTTWQEYVRYWPIRHDVGWAANAQVFSLPMYFMWKVVSMSTSSRKSQKSYATAIQVIFYDICTVTGNSLAHVSIFFLYSPWRRWIILPPALAVEVIFSVVSVCVCESAKKKTDRQTDRCYQVHNLPGSLSYAVD